jgi:hypothetical protein
VRTDTELDVAYSKHYPNPLAKIPKQIPKINKNNRLTYAHSAYLNRGMEIESWWGRDTLPVRAGPRVHTQSSVQWVPGFFPGG